MARPPPSKFSRGLRKKKINNHAGAAARAKVQVRENVLDEISRAGIDGVHVFDAFAGDGEMWRQVWRKADSYVGCDMTWYRDERVVFAGDNRRVLRAIDLARFNIFDLDAWGSPWEQVMIIAARRRVAPGECIGVILTEGSAMKLKLGGYPAALRILSGLRGLPAGGARGRNELTDRAILSFCRRLKARPIRRWQAIGKTGTPVVYIGLIIEGLPRVEKKAAPAEPVEGAAEAANSVLANS